MENIWLISIVALVVGTAIGFLMGRSGGSNQRQAELSEELENTKQELENYKADVTRHFETTATLVNNLTTSYKEVHEHLATGAQGLCQPGSIDMALEPAMSSNKLEQKEAATEAEPDKTAAAEEQIPEPPRDYAPKSPEDEGTLSESYGLKSKNKADEDTVAPPADAPLGETEKQK